MIVKDVTVINKLGMHARAAAKFVSLAYSIVSDIEMGKGNRNVN